MSATFVKQLRSKRPPLELATGPDMLTFRVQAAELWDAVRVAASPATTVGEVKRRTLETFFGADAFAGDYVLKLHGWEMLDETAAIAQSGVTQGSIVLLALRRRLPVR
jgi:hypothetical protein